VGTTLSFTTDAILARHSGGSAGVNPALDAHSRSLTRRLVWWSRTPGCFPGCLCRYGLSWPRCGCGDGPGIRCLRGGWPDESLRDSRRPCCGTTHSPGQTWMVGWRCRRPGEGRGPSGRQSAGRSCERHEGPAPELNDAETSGNLYSPAGLRAPMLITAFAVMGLASYQQLVWISFRRLSSRPSR